jgi:hypothetical protein
MISAQFHEISVKKQIFSLFQTYFSLKNSVVDPESAFEPFKMDVKAQGKTSRHRPPDPIELFEA